MERVASTFSSRIVNMLRRLCIGTIFVIWITNKLSYNEAVVFRFTNAVCESHNKSWMIINTCRLRAIGRNKIVFNFNGTILHPTNSISVHAQIFRKANGYKPWVINYTVDCCRFLKKNYNPFAVYINSIYIDFSNFNHSCPFVGDQIIDGFYLRVEMLKGLPIPNGEYLLTMKWFFYERKQFTTNLYYTFTDDLNRNN